MICPVCPADDTRVLDSRLVGDGASIRRRRECQRCAYRFSTVEDIQILDLAVIKRDGRREAYTREKLMRGIDRALEKRAVTREKRERLLQSIERDIHKVKASEVTSEEIGELIMKVLKKFDKVAYIRFASVYRQFEDVATFQKELAAIAPKRKARKK